MSVRRVLHVIPSVATVRGGPSFMIRTLTRGLAEAGVETHVVTTDDNGPGRAPVLGDMPRSEDGVRYWYFTRQMKFYTVSMPAARWLSEQIETYDVVHIHALFSHLSVAAAHLAAKRGVPYMIRPLGVLNRWGMQNRRPQLKALSFRMIESRLLRKAGLVHFTSEQEQEEALELGVDLRGAIIPNPATGLGDVALQRGRFRERRPEWKDRTLVLFLSRVDRKKGLDLLLPAFARVRERCPEGALVIGGDGDPALVAQLKERSAALGLSDDVWWPGFLSGDEKAAALADADLYVLPSYSENFGVSVVEAMSAGLPVIVSDQTAICREVAASGAGLVVPCKVEELADAMIELIRNRERRQAMGSNGREAAIRKFSLDAVVRQTLQAYERICH